MSREVRRVPLDFNWPMGKVWYGYLPPDKFKEIDCTSCDRGYSARAQELFDLWYGGLPFHPASTGSTSLRHDTAAVRSLAERNIASSPNHYGTGEYAIVREARRLAKMWNGKMSHHLTQEDVNALVEAERLMDFTHTWTKGAGWQRIEPPVSPTAAQVNEWSLSGFGHDSINAYVVISARCEREGVSNKCPNCNGCGSIEAYAGQRAEAEAWELTEPPAGDGWQLWETTSEGSPKSPVFATGDELAQWMSRNPVGFGGTSITLDVAMRWVHGSGWAPSMVGSQNGLQDGITWAAGESES